MTEESVALLRITDGTVAGTVDLISKVSGIHLFEWNPQVADIEAVFQESPLSDERRPVGYKYPTVNETFSYAADEFNQDTLIAVLQNLRRLLVKALNYWVGVRQTGPVWIEARGAREGNTRYGLIRFWRTPEDSNPYDSPFLIATPQTVAMDSLSLIIERGHWLAYPPGTGAGVQASGQAAFSGVTFGRAATTATEVYVANKYSVSNLTHIYRYDASAATFSGNLVGAALPFDLFPASPAVNDILYLGTNTALANSGPFLSLVYDIGVAMANIGFDPEYWSGAAWVTATINETSEGAGITRFSSTGVHSMHWGPLSGWAATAINGITAFWMRLRITFVGGGPVMPTQQNRDIYTATLPYVEIASDQVGGDIPALSRIKIQNQSRSASLSLGVNRIIVGLRSIPSNSGFSAYINVSDEQNVSGVSIGLGTNTTYSNDVSTPTGRRATYNPGGVEAVATRVQITLADTIVTDYYGTYHAYLRGRRTAGAVADISVRLQVSTGEGGMPFTTESKQFQTTTDFEVLDFGRITIPNGPFNPADIAEYSTINIQASAASGTPDVYFHDLILIPTDEWAGEFIDRTNTLGSRLGGSTLSVIAPTEYLDVDSLMYLRRNIRALVRTSTNRIASVYQPNANGPVITHAGIKQRYWFLAMQTNAVDTASPIWLSRPEYAHAVSVECSARYLSMRGNR